MPGEGFMQHMIESSRNNRALLNSGGAKYKNFDKSYITDWVISRKPLKFKTATPQYLQKLREEMKLEKKKSRLRSLLAAAVTLLIAAGILALVF